ncbi:MAG: hypothetical protein HY268_08475 [Deltaproteobacteria bacterium]|nr:hypothetical protein [Deltaproteobacteria bacterium]
MTITIELAPELERQLRDEAAKEGLDTGEYIVYTLEERLRHTRQAAPRLSSAETELLQQINLGLSQEDWQRYHTLIAKRRAETLTPDEHAALIALSDQIEEANVRRIQALVELTRLRQTSLEALMQELGLPASAYV